MSDLFQHGQSSTPQNSDTLGSVSTPKPYSPPSVVVVGQWKAVTLLISTPLSDIGGNGLFEPLKYFGSE